MPVGVVVEQCGHDFFRHFSPGSAVKPQGFADFGFVFRGYPDLPEELRLLRMCHNISLYHIGLQNKLSTVRCVSHQIS